MKFLIDNALSPLIAERLKDAGYDAVHVCACGLQSAPDELIFARAKVEGRIIVSADTDFATILTLRREQKPSVILFRRAGGRRPEQQSALLLANMSRLREPMEQGCVAVFDASRIRIRLLSKDDGLRSE